MYTEPSSNIGRYVGGLSDPGKGRNVQPLGLDIITMAVCGMICGVDNWVDIERFVPATYAWLSSFLELKRGIAAHDSFGRVFRWLKGPELSVS